MLLFTLFLHIASAYSQASGWIPEPFNPPNLPLAVKSPYVNCWLPQGPNSSQANALWPQTWNNSVSDELILGWNAAIRVDGQPYNLLGIPGVLTQANANQTNVLFTPTRTSFLFMAGAINVNMTFLSPIEAHDLTHLSMPFSYMYLSVTSSDNNAHEIQFYSDVTAEWISGDSSSLSDWAPENTADFTSMYTMLTNKGEYQEIAERPQDGTLYFSMKKRSGLSWEIYSSFDMREAFANGTGLKNLTDSHRHAINNPFDALGISVDVGSIEPGAEIDPVVYTIGVVRDPVIRYTNNINQIEDRSAYYWANFSLADDILRDALDHFNDALIASVELDNKLLAAANSISTEYAGLISLVTRSAMSAIEYTIVKNDNDISDVKAFMKNMGNVGSGQVNAVDIIYAAMPVYLYLNPDIIGYLLSPLLDAQMSSRYTNNYAAIDLGGPFPNATGDIQGHNEGIEQSANMIILSLAHAQVSGNGNLLLQYYKLLTKWGDYLVDNTMSSSDQTTSSLDYITSRNQSNLILKGIIAIRAMAEISSLMGDSDNENRYKTEADQYYQTWEIHAIASDRIVLNFGGANSGLIYNLYADRILGLNVVKESVYTLQTSFYRTHISEQEYGVPLDISDDSISRIDWMLYAASSTTDIQVQNDMIHQVYLYATTNFENKPLPVVYNPSNGSINSGLNSPAQGAIFAPLALTVNKTTVAFSLPPHSGTHVTKGLIAGSVIGGLFGATTLVACILFCCRLRQNKTLSRYKNDTSHIGHQERPVSRVNSSCGPIELSSPVRDNQYQESQNQNYVDTIPDPFRLSVPLDDSVVQRTPLASKRVNPGSALQSGSMSGPTIESSAVTRRSSQADGEGAWREEVNNLRMEIERMREETAPPSYES